MRSRTDVDLTRKDGGAPAGDVQPLGYHQSLFPPLPEPPFEDAEERERVWGARWEALRYFGVELIVVPMSCFSLHLDGAFAMVDVDKALVQAGDLPYWFLSRLADLRIEAIWCHPDEPWAVNSLTISPRRVIMSEGHPYTAERLERRGVEVVSTPLDEIQKNGGGTHCSTTELMREDV